MSDASNGISSVDESIDDSDDSSYEEDNNDYEINNLSEAVHLARLRQDWNRKQMLLKKYVDDGIEVIEEGVDCDNGVPPSSKELVWVLEQLCDSDALSIESLQRIFDEGIIGMGDVAIKSKNSTMIYGSSFFHRACYNKQITEGIIDYLLDFYPEAARIITDYFCSDRLDKDRKSTSFALHLACLNSHCSSDIVVKLVKLNTEALDIENMCVIGTEIQTGDYDHTNVEGTPLHYYLSRTSNVNLEVVKLFMKMYPNSTRFADEEAAFAPIHVLCFNPGVNDMLDVLRFLIDSDPESVQFPGGYSSVPFLMACQNTNATVELLNILLEYWPEAIHQTDVSGENAMHLLSSNDELDEQASEELFHFILGKKFDLLRETDLDEYLPIHCAARHKSPKFCQLLLDAYPESLKIGVEGSLPFHEACNGGLRVDTVKFLHKLYPECIGMEDEYGYLPIHKAAQNRGEQAAEIIKYILLQDPDAASKLFNGHMLPLHLACNEYGVNLDTIKVLFNDYPEAMYKMHASGTSGKRPIDMAMERRDGNAKPIVAFLKEQLAHVIEAKKDPSYRLPLHRALLGDISLGAIKLIVKDFPASIHTSNCEGALPLHVACCNASLESVKYLVEMDPSHLDVCDEEGKYPLHYACDSANHDVIRYLLDINAQSISERDADNMLPFHLLCMSAEVGDPDDIESPECTETIWRVLTAYPDAILSAKSDDVSQLLAPILYYQSSFENYFGYNV